MKARPEIVTVIKRLLCFTRNPLIRWSDRLEAALMIGAVLLALLAIPFAAAVGSGAYAEGKGRAAEQAANRQETTAVLLADAPPVHVRLDGVPLDEKAEAVARWTVPGGLIREGVVTVDAGTATGNEVRIWLDASGRPVEAPVTDDDALSQGIGVGTGLWLGWVTLVATVFLACRAALGRSRAAEWAREWRRVAQDRPAA
ncbi:hypothetical protein [Amycolatopsis decaplanina]|uniref:Transmembrane protein n=1 Tax=Amycolatopsis decaplanina DSM 44594 TaxID=1284240 RepID=M2Z2N1_9PSEU|nr:hypothetical protein [Amycolatopsis decaplanina]EME55098.1 transmembrane protein [Amycolatopsis decaplanina DSM 44594]